MSVDGGYSHSTNNTAFSFLIYLVIVPPIVRLGALSHEHACTCGRLKHVINALVLERAAFLVRACANLVGYTSAFLGANEVGEVWGTGWWTQVRLAANEEHGYVLSADVSYFFNPLYGNVI